MRKEGTISNIYWKLCHILIKIIKNKKRIWLTFPKDCDLSSSLGAAARTQTRPAWRADCAALPCRLEVQLRTRLPSSSSPSHPEKSIKSLCLQSITHALTCPRCYIFENLNTTFHPINLKKTKNFFFAKLFEKKYSLWFHQSRFLLYLL